MSIFYKPNVVVECPLCGAQCPDAYFPHLLSPCPLLHTIFRTDEGRAFCTLLQLGR
jgi:hypothetical protein